MFKPHLSILTMLAGAAFASAATILAFASRADAHGHLNEPKPTFKDGESTVNWVVQIDNFWDIGSGGDQVGKYKTMAKEKGMSVKDVVLDMVGADKKCGFTRTDVDPQPIPTDGKAKWLGNDGGGFTHTLYIDDKMVLHSDDCETDYPGGPNDSGEMSVMPVDYSSCNGNCIFTIYWLGFQNAQWQAYINCVPLSGSGGSTKQTQSSPGSSTGTKSAESSSTGATPSTETQSESSSDQTPATESSGETPTTESSSPGSPSTLSTPAPAETESPSTDTPATPSTETDTKCTPARRLRNKTS
ncbi:hypothetical protein PC116_g15127 [Phytophthora cactorum]|nr:hypothetical protein PC116_g15127 [Phytophthora cactorum]